MFLTWMTCIADRLEHAVTDEQFTAAQRSGVYLAVCGHEVAAQPMICPPGLRCRACLRRVVAVSDRPRQHLSWWSRWLAGGAR